MLGFSHESFPSDFVTLSGPTPRKSLPLAIPQFELDNEFVVNQVNNNEMFNEFVSSPTRLFDSKESNCSIIKIVKYADLKGGNTKQYNSRSSESPLSNERNSIIESMNKVCRYSSKEKKESIERYKSKKNQRNFNKKIKYVCRKTLADCRPRVKGRFIARYNEIGRLKKQDGAEEMLNDEGAHNWMLNLSYLFSSS
uniref:zinc finger protein CONSTANS-LIKE 9-like n=1 Tax=Erigeron canadensis TaxID=72917 RepID=UPI001CB8E361|nr:zinc finger protein CONSTANS-LIKE 9-like [Erigeron canadensis]